MLLVMPLVTSTEYLPGPYRDAPAGSGQADWLPCDSTSHLEHQPKPFISVLKISHWKCFLGEMLTKQN